MGDEVVSVVVDVMIDDVDVLEAEVGVELGIVLDSVVMGEVDDIEVMVVVIGVVSVVV